MRCSTNSRKLAHRASQRERLVGLVATGFHDLAGMHAGGAGRRAGTAIKAEEGLFLERSGKIDLVFGDRLGQGDPAARRGAFPAGQDIGRAGRQAEAAAHALQHAFVIRFVGKGKIAKTLFLSHASPPLPHHERSCRDSGPRAGQSCCLMRRMTLTPPAPIWRSR